MKYWLHYVGKGLYTPRHFAREAERYGVNRVVPLGMLGGFEFGDVVLLAEHRRVENKEYAVVFGYFRVLGVTVPEGWIEKAGIGAECDPSGGSSVVKRSCGSYEVAATCTTHEEIKEIARKLREACAKDEFCHIRVFISGPYHALDKPLLIEGAKFHRSYSRLEVDLSLEELSGFDKKLVVIRGYRQRRRLRKKERAALDNVVLDEYMGGWMA